VIAGILWCCKYCHAESELPFELGSGTGSNLPIAVRYEDSMHLELTHEETGRIETAPFPQSPISARRRVCQHGLYYTEQNQTWHKKLEPCLVLLNDLPAARGRRVGGHALKHNVDGTVKQGPVRQVCMSRDPATVRGAPVIVKTHDSTSCQQCV
jgi:hypothetical protein